MVRMERRPRSGEFRRSGLLGVGRELLVAVDELADVVLQPRQLRKDGIDFLEVRDDLPLGGFTLRASRRPRELAGDGIVLLPQYRNR